VIDPSRYGWTIVKYQPRDAAVPYRHGSDQLYVA
jgi:hypothetical protein